MSKNRYTNELKVSPKRVFDVRVDAIKIKLKRIKVVDLDDTLKTIYKVKN